MSVPRPRGSSARIACAFAVGAAVGALNFVFMPRLAPFAPIWGLGQLLALGALGFSLAAAVTLVIVRHRNIPRLPLAVLWCAAGAGLGTVCSAWWFRSQREAALERAIAFCDALRPPLESFQRAHGRFPQSLREFQYEAPRPLLALTGDVTYRSTPEHFEFRVNTSRGLGFHGACFDSRTGEWSR